PLVSYAVVTGGRDTLALDRTVFSVDSSARGAGGLPMLTFRGALGGDTAMITYTFSPDSYLVRVRGRCGLPARRRARRGRCWFRCRPDFDRPKRIRRR